ncbi:hypothetical protein PoB_006726700 [Plakobranchus ocellatus]|uniref:Uncharacterized protein n=1 Tax=Plakobranchus ocellatus TaxID=259542 RepID=A0AAV4D9M0_9GAST|nr:hypothetical protein PoB_006726700 [Plakobranchus ocellatus]
MFPRVLTAAAMIAEKSKDNDDDDHGVGGSNWKIAQEVDAQLRTCIVRIPGFQRSAPREAAGPVPTYLSHTRVYLITWTVFAFPLTKQLNPS